MLSFTKVVNVVLILFLTRFVDNKDSLGCFNSPWHIFPSWEPLIHGLYRFLEHFLYVRMRLSTTMGKLRLLILFGPLSPLRIEDWLSKGGSVSWGENINLCSLECFVATLVVKVQFSFTYDMETCIARRIEL